MPTWKIFVILLPISVLVDLLWVGVVMEWFYNQQLGDLARRQGESLTPRWWAAIFAYLLIPSGIVLFVRPLLRTHSSIWQVFTTGALFGLVLYGVYDFTNLAVLERWTLSLTLVDISWGCFFCGILSIFMQFFDLWLSKKAREN